MLGLWKRWRPVAAALGLFAAGGLVGGWAMHASRPEAGVGLPQELVLQAAGASNNDAFAIATGRIDQDVEGVFLLDFLTGELRCSVINPRTGKFGGLFATNVIQVLGVDQQKKPRYLLATGDIAFNRGGAASRPAGTVCYVVDANTGAYAAFGLAWNRTVAQTGNVQSGQLIVYDGGKMRNVEISE